MVSSNTGHQDDGYHGGDQGSSSPDDYDDLHSSKSDANLSAKKSTQYFLSLFKVGKGPGRAAGGMFIPG